MTVVATTIGRDDGDGDSRVVSRVSGGAQNMAVGLGDETGPRRSKPQSLGEAVGAVGVGDGCDRVAHTGNA